jgi:hypothetical protein
MTQDNKREIRQWYEFALQQVAAESYIFNLASPDDALKNGNNIAGTPDDKMSGRTRMTEKQTKLFTENYQVIDQLQNTSSGFSATVLKDKDGTYTLAFRSTEYQNAPNGDFEQNGVSSNIPTFSNYVSAARTARLTVM